MTDNKKESRDVLRYKLGDTSPIFASIPDITELPTREYGSLTKLRLMAYLTNKDFRKVSSLLFNLTNAFTGEEWEATGSLFDDGEWMWPDDLWLYIRDYNIAVPDEFIAHVHDFFQADGKVEPVVPRMGFSKRPDDPGLW